MSTTSLLPAGTPPSDAGPVTVLTVLAWPDPVIDALGHDPRSSYVERFWLGILGPSTTWLLRHLAAGLDASPEGFDLDLPQTAQALGLGSRGGRHSPFMRALTRLCQFDLAEARPEGALAVRRRVPPLNRRQVLRLPPPLAEAHQAWQTAQLQTPASEQQRRRARRLAAGLEANPAGFELPLADTAAALGLGSKGGRHSPFIRALTRCCQFDLAEARSPGAIAVRRKLPPLTRRQVQRLPVDLQTAHQAWQDELLRTPPADQLRRRCRRLALSLVELGEDFEATERQLARWKFHPVLCRESAAWAVERHRQAHTPDDAA